MMKGTKTARKYVTAFFWENTDHCSGSHIKQYQHCSEHEYMWDTAKPLLLCKVGQTNVECIRCVSAIDLPCWCTALLLSAGLMDHVKYLNDWLCPDSLGLQLLSTTGGVNVNNSMTEWEGTAEAKVGSMTQSFRGSVTFWYEVNSIFWHVSQSLCNYFKGERSYFPVSSLKFAEKTSIDRLSAFNFGLLNIYTKLCNPLLEQSVELRSPAQEDSDVILTSYYSSYWGSYWTGYSYTYNRVWSAGSYNSDIPGAPTSVPSDVAIRDESNRAFQLVGASCLDSELSLPTGLECQGSGVRPNTTDAPPSMLGDGPCEQPFIDWQVVASSTLARALHASLEFFSAVSCSTPFKYHEQGTKTFSVFSGAVLFSNVGLVL